MGRGGASTGCLCRKGRRSPSLGPVSAQGLPDPAPRLSQMEGKYQASSAYLCNLSPASTLLIQPAAQRRAVRRARA